MGWDGTRPSFWKNGKVDRKAEVDNRFTWENEDARVSVKKSAMKSTTWYGAVERYDKITQESVVIGVVALTRMDREGYFMVKTMEETSGPYSYECPESILKLLSPTDNEWANQWRENCRAVGHRKNELRVLPIGTKIKTKFNDEDIILTKMAPTRQFKTTWWYNAEKHNYLPKRYITNYEVLE